MAQYDLGENGPRKPSNFYCPACGEVRHGFKHWALGWIVGEHHRRVDTWECTTCPGGSIDPDKDRVH